MKMVKSLFLGSAAGLVAVAGAQAADLPVKAKPVQYVKICSLYGAGFYYIPGTDTCIKLGGFVRAEEDFNANGSYAQYHALNFDNNNANRYFSRTRGLISVDARSQTQYGTLRAYLDMSMQDDNSNVVGGSPYFQGRSGWANNAFIQFAGFTFGKTTSFFDFDTQPYSNQTNQWGSNQSGNGVQVWAYTAQFGNGISASIAAEDNIARQTSIAFSGGSNGNANGYAGKGWPDIVANLRADQAWGSAQVMVAAHDLNPAYASTGGMAGNFSVAGRETGWAGGAGVKVNLPMLGMGDYALAQFTYAVGASNYAFSGNTGVGGADYYFMSHNDGTFGEGDVFDSVIVAGSQHLVTSWSITGGYEHRWNPNWKSSLYGAYGQFRFDDITTAALTGGGPGDANWSLWQVGTRTVWTPVENLDLSVEVMYNALNSAEKTSDAPLAQDQSWFSGIIRVQRNFWP
jgi:hypothetical protein